MNDKKKFPWGMLVLMLVLLILASCFVSAGYFYCNARVRSAEIAREARATYTIMADTLASLAEISYLSRDMARIRRAFMEKPAAGDVLESFFVLSNGVVIAHSSAEKAKSLQGNIARDEFAYNLDQIFLPLRNNSREVYFQDYNIVDRKIPYPRDIWVPLKKYVYGGIDRVGWLVTRAVHSRGKPIGTVNIIISKQRIYGHIDTTAKHSIILMAGMALFSLGLSLIISIFVYRRYGKPAVHAATPAREPLPAIAFTDDDAIEEPEMHETEPIFEATAPFQGIKDAIPVAK